MCLCPYNLLDGCVGTPLGEELGNLVRNSVWLGIFDGKVDWMLLGLDEGNAPGVAVESWDGRLLGVKLGNKVLLGSAMGDRVS